jgi:hypothetical protein
MFRGSRAEIFPPWNRDVAAAGWAFDRGPFPRFVKSNLLAAEVAEKNNVILTRHVLKLVVWIPVASKRQAYRTPSDAKSPIATTAYPGPAGR